MEKCPCLSQRQRRVWRALWHRWLQLSEVLELHSRLLMQTGGRPGLRDLEPLETSWAVPRQSVMGADLYLGLIAKAAALARIGPLISGDAMTEGDPNRECQHLAQEACGESDL